MNDLHEAVTLPDPAVKRLLHPADLPQARPLYLRGWWFGRLCSLPIVVALGTVVWTLTGNLFAALAAPIGTFAVGFAASRWHQARAWDFIPRKRQDPTDAGPWQLIAAALDAVALLLAVGAATLPITTAPIPPGIVAYAVGSGLGIAVLQIAEIVLAARNRQNSSIASQVILLAAVITAAVLVAVLGGVAWGPGAYALAAAGLVTVLLAYALWSLFTQRGRQDKER